MDDVLKWMINGWMIYEGGWYFVGWDWSVVVWGVVVGGVVFVLMFVNFVEGIIFWKFFKLWSFN